MNNTSKSYDLLCLIIQSGFYVNYDKGLEWGYQEGYSLQDTLGLSTEDLKPFMSKEQLDSLERR